MNWSELREKSRWDLLVHTTHFLLRSKKHQKWCCMGFICLFWGPLVCDIIIFLILTGYWTNKMEWLNVVNIWGCPWRLEMWDGKSYGNYIISVGTPNCTGTPKLKVVMVHPFIKQAFMGDPTDHSSSGLRNPKQTKIYQHRDSDKIICPWMAGTPMISETIFNRIVWIIGPILMVILLV